MKKLPLLLLVMLIIFTSCGKTTQPAEATSEPAATTVTELQTYPEYPDAPTDFTGMKEADLQPYFALAEETYKRYITEVLFAGNQPLQYPLQMTPPLQKYTALRIANDGKAPFGSDSMKNVTARMGDWQIIQGKLLCTLGVDVQYDETSAFGGSVQMLIENPQEPMLSDWFDLDKGSWDRTMREGTANWGLTDPENWLGNCKLKQYQTEIYGSTTQAEAYAAYPNAPKEFAAGYTNEQTNAMSPEAFEALVKEKETEFQAYFGLVKQVAATYYQSLYAAGGPAPQLLQLPLRQSPLLEQYLRARYAKEAETIGGGKQVEQLKAVEFPNGVDWSVVDGVLVCVTRAYVTLRYEGDAQDTKLEFPNQILIENPQQPTLCHFLASRRGNGLSNTKKEYWLTEESVAEFQRSGIVVYG